MNHDNRFGKTVMLSWSKVEWFGLTKTSRKMIIGSDLEKCSKNRLIGLAEIEKVENNWMVGLSRFEMNVKWL